MSKLSGYEAEFVEPPQELQSDCSICLSILRNPHLVHCCGMSFCYGCIKYVLNERRPQCPLCKGDPNPIAEDKRLNRQLSQRDVYCSNKRIGCKWVGLLAEYDNHINSGPSPTQDRLSGCLFIKVECLYCEELFNRKDLARHEETCTQRPYTCEYCKEFTGTRYILNNQHYGVCDRYPVQCTNDCGKPLPRFQLNSHLVNDCPLTTVNCNYSYAGCDVWLMRRDLDNHLAMNAKKHAALLDKENSALMCDVHKLHMQLAIAVEDSLSFLAENKKLKKENHELRSSVQENECELMEVMSNLTLKNSDIKELEKKLKECEDKVKKYSEDLKKSKAQCKEKDSLLQTHTLATRTHKERVAKLEEQLEEADLELGKKESLLEDLYEKNALVQGQLAEKEQEIEELTHKLASVKKECETEVARVHLEIENKERMITELEKKLKKSKGNTQDLSPIYKELPMTPNTLNTTYPPPSISPYTQPATTSLSQTTYPEPPLRKLSGISLSQASYPVQHSDMSFSPATLSQQSTTGVQASKSTSPSTPPPVLKDWNKIAAKKKPEPSQSEPSQTIPRPHLLPAKSRTLPAPPKGSNQFKLMIRNTPSRARQVTDANIIELFSQFGQVYDMDRKGSNTALVFDNIDSVTRGVVASEQRRLVLDGTILNCTYDKEQKKRRNK